MAGIYASACSIIHFFMDDDNVAAHTSALEKLSNGITDLTEKEASAMKEFGALVNRLKKELEPERAARNA